MGSGKRCFWASRRNRENLDHLEVSLHNDLSHVWHRHLVNAGRQVQIGWQICDIVIGLEVRGHGDCL